MRARAWLGLFALACALPAQAGEVQIIKVKLVLQEDAWQASVTLRHDDAGWDHYADMWRLVTEAGEVLATRTLAHPHMQEQPFTRSLDGIAIPEGVSVVYAEAHDTVHGWAPKRARVDLNREEGERYRVRRKLDRPSRKP